MLALEDTFGDILRKAMRGTHKDADRLSSESGIARSEIDRWLADDGGADTAQARALARALDLDAQKLAVSAASGWYPPEVDVPNVRRHAQLPHPSNGYVVSLDGGARAALIDPAGVPENLLRAIRTAGCHLEYVLITHKHDDHCDATAEIAAAFPQAQIVIHPLDAHAIGILAASAIMVRDKENVSTGSAAPIEPLHTPGHTDGSTCYVIGSTVFTGDVLFAASVGGAYGDRSTYGDILTNVREKLFALPDDTVVMPGHGPPTTIGWEKLHNPFFR